MSMLRLICRKKKAKKGKSRSKQTMIKSLYIPENIIEQILHYLPYDAMVRSKLVCKSWNSLISSPNYMDDHYNLRRLVADNHLIVLDYKKLKDFNFYSLSNANLVDDDHSSASMLSPLREPEKWGLVRPRLLGSYNGLVAISCYDKLILWNPLTKKYSLAPIEVYDEHSDSNNYDRRLLFGLCYDGSKDEYSVVVGTDYQSPPVSPSNAFEPIDYESSAIFLHNFNDGRLSIINDSCWRLLDTKLFDGETGKVICGSPHWVVHEFCNFKEMCVKTEIIYFDLEMKEFKEMSRPEGCGEKALLGLAAMDGENQLGCVLHDTAGSSLEVWAMKEYGKAESWTNLFTFSDLYVTASCGSIRYMDVIGFMPNGELLVYLNGEELCVSNVEKGNYREINLFNRLVTYRPKLTSPPEPPKECNWFGKEDR